MSSILKAIRKLEEERRGGKLEPPDLRVDRGQTAAVNSPLIPLAAGIVCGAVVVGLFFLWPDGTDKNANVGDRISPPEAAQVATPQPALAELRVPQPPVESQPVPDTSEAQQHAAPPADVASEATTPATEDQTTATNPADQSNAASKIDLKPAKQTQLPATPVSKEPVKPAIALIDAPPPAEGLPLPEGVGLTVTEIFYQDADNSMAVVNDLPVMVGSHVDAAVVTAIHADRVLFELDGKVYSVSVSAP